MMTVKASDADPTAGADGHSAWRAGRYQVGDAVQDIEAAREQLIAFGEQVVSDLEGSAVAGGRWCYFPGCRGRCIRA